MAQWTDDIAARMVRAATPAAAETPFAYLIIADRHYVGAAFEYDQAITEAEDICEANGWKVGIAQVPLIELITPGKTAVP